MSKKKENQEPENEFDSSEELVKDLFGTDENNSSPDLTHSDADEMLDDVDKKTKECDKEEKGKEDKKSEKHKLEEELKKAKELSEDYKRKWYSVSAEYDNYRKRTQAATSKAYADGLAEAILKLLPVADNFGYAYDSAADEKTKAGIEKVIKSFNTIISSLGVKEIEIAENAPFDESVAEAIMTVPCEDGEEANTVKQVLKKGYRSGDKVIRFAQVIVRN
jgi:molecular chaperone GrpE